MRRIRLPKDLCEDAVRVQAKVLPLAAEPPRLSSNVRTTTRTPRRIISATCSTFLPYEDNAA